MRFLCLIHLHFRVNFSMQAKSIKLIQLQNHAIQFSYKKNSTNVPMYM